MNKEILRLSIPNIISNVTIPLLGMVDMALMGHLGSEIFIGAIALGGVIFNFIYWGFSFLRMSTSGFTSQAFGRNDNEETFYLLIRSVMVALSLSILIIIMQSPIEWISFKAIGGSAEVEKLAAQYFRIRVWAAPATLSLYAITGWLLGMQNARYPMIIAVVSNIINIVLSVLFVFYFHMQSDGVALGTALAQYSGLAIAVYLLNRKYKYLIIKIKKSVVFDLKKLHAFFKVNTDIFIRTFCIIIVFTFFTSKSASTNDTILAVNSLLIQFLLFFSFFIDGFAFAGEALTGRFIGAHKISNLKKVVKQLFIWGIGLVGLFTVSYLIGLEWILKFLTNNQAIITEARPYYFWVVLIPIASFTSFVWDGIYIGATASKAMRNTMLISAFLIFTPTYYLLDKVIHNHALWLAMVLFMVSRGIIQTILYKPAILKKL